MHYCFFVADLHGKRYRYEKLFEAIRNEKPDALFIGGDILPSYGKDDFFDGDFILGYIRSELLKLKSELKDDYPDIFIIMGNDDPRSEESKLEELDCEDLWHYVHFRKIKFADYNIIGYSFIPPTPFLLKDWEKYDVSVFVDPGCVHPTAGCRSVEPKEDISFTNIKKDLVKLSEGLDFDKSIFLFHTPPYKSYLDRAALDGKKIEHVPLDVHVGSIAVQRFIKSKQPYLTMHAHVHESSSITGDWKQVFNKTTACSAAYEKEKLALVSFYLEDLSGIKRRLI